MSDNTELVNLLAKTFIARPDVKARQYSGGYVPDELKDGTRLPWDRASLEAHLAGTQTYGHYMLSTDDNVKLFAFDVDLEKSGHYFNGDLPEEADENLGWEEVPDLRGAWMDRAFPGRSFLKYQMHEIAHKLGRVIEDELEIPWAAAYTGGKGIHVYGFTGLVPASDARDGGVIALEAFGAALTRGQNFFKHPNFPNFSIELFPKQTSLDGKDLGNLMRMPLGKNLKNPADPTFFLDMTAAMGTLAPLDPVYALTTPSQWKRPGE